MSQPRATACGQRGGSPDSLVTGLAKPRRWRRTTRRWHRGCCWRRRGVYPGKRRKRNSGGERGRLRPKQRLRTDPEARGRCAWTPPTKAAPTPRRSRPKGCTVS